jgi:hypothetical protein
MKRIALTLLIGFGLALPAFADRMPLPANTPGQFQGGMRQLPPRLPARPARRNDWRAHQPA